MLIPNTGFGAGHHPRVGQDVLDDDLADVVAVGRQFLANPDLPRAGDAAPSSTSRTRDTFYGGGAEGYTDYPSLAG